MTGAMVKYSTEHGEVQLSPDIVRKYLVSGNADKVTHQEVMMFLQLCKFSKLNPFLREAYLIKFGNEAATMITGKEVFTKRAAAAPNCAGWEAGVIVQDSNGKIEHREGTFLMPGDKLIGGWAKVFRKDWSVPASATVSLAEYQRFKADGTPMANWKSIPATMIRKVALVQALREAFPETFQGLYSPEEMPLDTSVLSEDPIDVEAEVVDTTMDDQVQEPVKEVKEKQGDLISPNQAKRMFALAEGDSDLVKAIIKGAGYEKTSEIPKSKYETLCAQIEEAKKAEQQSIEDALSDVEIEN
jgi:phage recombination protein Bet